MFHYLSKTSELKIEKIVEIKASVKAYHPMINPIEVAPHRILNGVEMAPEKGEVVAFAEKRYKLIPNVNFVPFDDYAKKISEKSEGFGSKEESKISKEDETE